MIKFKILYTLYFLLAFQVAFSSSYQKEEINSCIDKTENVILWEENSHSPFIFGEVPVGHGSLLVSFPDKQYFLLNFNAKDLHIALIQSILSSASLQGKTVYFGCSGYYIINIPIYLQTDKFRL